MPEYFRSKYAVDLLPQAHLAKHQLSQQVAGKKGKDEGLVTEDIFRWL